MVPIELGIVGTPLPQQLAVFGLDKKVVSRLEAINQSINTLSVHGYIPDSQAERSRKKLMRVIETEVRNHVKARISKHAALKCATRDCEGCEACDLT